MSIGPFAQLDLALQAFNLMPITRDTWDCAITSPPPTNDVLFLAIDANFLSHSLPLLPLVGEIGLSYLDSRKLNNVSNPKRNGYNTATNVYNFLPESRHICFAPRASKDFLFSPDLSSHDFGSVRKELLLAVRIRRNIFNPKMGLRSIVIVTSGDGKLEILCQQFAIDKEPQVVAFIDIPTLCQQIFGLSIPIESLLPRNACPFALSSHHTHLNSDGPLQLPLFAYNNPGNRAHYTLLAMMAALSHSRLKVFDPIGFPNRPERDHEMATVLGFSAYEVDLYHYPVEKRISDEKLEGLCVLGLRRSKETENASEGVFNDLHWG